MMRWQGEWHLELYLHLVDEIPEECDDSHAASTRAWLLGNDSLPASQLESQSGLVFKIEDHEFAELGLDFARLMFDGDGVQVNDYTTLSGKIIEREDIAFLLCDGLVQSGSEVFDGIILRYDDGDTKVCDSLRLDGGCLIRQISVVTDEIYLERICLAYRRVKESQ